MTHAAVSFALTHPEVAIDWHNISNYIVQLSVKDEAALHELRRKVEQNGLIHFNFREPAMNNAFTAIAIEPSDVTQRLTSNLPLAFKVSGKDDIVFHFNKMSLTDNTVPMWVLKHKGSTHYVHHVDVSDCVAWSTKETPLNEHTKGSIKFKGNLTLIEENNQLIAKIN